MEMRKMENKKWRYVPSSDYWRFFKKDRETGLFHCKICAEDGIQVITANQVTHMKQKHMPVYLEEREKLRKKRELYEMELWKNTTGSSVSDGVDLFQISRNGLTKRR